MVSENIHTLFLISQTVSENICTLFLISQTASENIYILFLISHMVTMYAHYYQFGDVHYRTLCVTFYDISIVS
jgi:hypothetical protein